MNKANPSYSPIYGRAKSDAQKSKRCPSCRKTKALKYFYRSDTSEDGYRTKCKECEALAQSGHRQVMSYKFTQIKKCSECGRLLPITEFGIDKSKAYGHRSYCKGCMEEQKRRRRRPQLVKQPKSKL